MNTLILLTLLTLLLTISVSISKPSHHNSGFTVDLIHRDSPLSSLHNPTYSLSDRQTAIRRSRPRVDKPGFASKIDADIFNNPGGDYVMKIQMGTPPVQVFASVNFCNDFMFIPCKPCKNCHMHKGVPFLVPESSSTYQTQSCHSKACETIHFKSPCDTHNVCHFDLGMRELGIIGDIAMDTLWFGTTPIKQVMFGCVNDYKNYSSNIGIGNTSLSFIYQSKEVTRGKFAYCLLPRIHDASNQTSKIYFGESAKVSGRNVVSTPLVTKEDFELSWQYYFVTLYEIVVENKSSLSYDNQTSFNINHDEEEDVYGNIVVDFELQTTYLPEGMYDIFSASMIKAIGNETVKDPRGLYEICYKDLNLDRVPDVTFWFDGAPVKVPPENLFFEVQKGASCLDVLSDDEYMPSLGNLLQRNLMVGIDLVEKMVYFKPSDCTK